MRSAVRKAWPDFVDQYEGRIAWLYLDTKKLATFGLGNMVDSGAAITAYGLVQPWRDKANRLVPEVRIEDEYDLIHSREDLAPRGGAAFKDVATLHLDDHAIDEALWGTTDDFWSQLGKMLPALDSWPADAQLALLNMAWNLGPNFMAAGGWPNFTKAAKTADFAGCALHCTRAVMADRDKRNRCLFYYAAAVVISGDEEVVHG